MPTINISKLKVLVQGSDQAYEEFVRASRRWVQLQGKLSVLPVHPEDELAEALQAEAVNAARSKHTNAMGEVVATLRTAILEAEYRPYTVEPHPVVPSPIATQPTLERASVSFHIELISQAQTQQEAEARFEYVRGYIDALYAQLKFDKQERKTLRDAAQVAKEAWPAKA